MDTITLLIILAALALFAMFLDWEELRIELWEMNQDDEDKKDDAIKSDLSDTEKT